MKRYVQLYYFFYQALCFQVGNVPKHSRRRSAHNFVAIPNNVVHIHDIHNLSYLAQIESVLDYDEKMRIIFIFYVFQKCFKQTDWCIAISCLPSMWPHNRLKIQSLYTLIVCEWKRWIRCCILIWILTLWCRFEFFTFLFSSPFPWFEKTTECTEFAFSFERWRSCARS